MRHVICFIIIALMAHNPLASAFAADGSDAARAHVDALGKKVLEVVNSSVAEEQKQQQLQQMFSGNVDMEWMAKFVLGPKWNSANEAEREQYLQAYRDFLLARYTTNFAEYAGSDYTITGVKNVADNEYLVSMNVESPQAEDQETRAGYRVRSENGKFRIIDIIIEGVSLITTQRSEFAAVLDRSGMEGLIQAIQTKTEKERTQAQAK